ncbi:hypothetical protein B0H16DRAFT_1484959 [Mycena metata]|uniref:Uncharacterized protein n=1 Tax=Mycena metata TaxID=1033252 RepID=A0AAD7DPZ9_9AGAR|nr:hypothetical protein B0H16DRAFT_1484959 [Mycena metata]
MPLVNPSMLHQYLARDSFNPLPTVTTALTARKPAEIMSDAVTRLWRKVNAGEPIPASPSYTASPVMEYYGLTHLKDGTPAHVFTRLGNCTVMYDPSTEKVHVGSGHELVYQFAAPLDPSELWKFEAPYPLSDHIRHKVIEISGAPWEAGDVGFPVHATPVNPPMYPLEERLRGRPVHKALTTQSCFHSKTWCQLAEYFVDVTSTGSPAAASDSSTDVITRPAVDLREVSRQVLAGFRVPVRVESEVVRQLNKEIDNERFQRLSSEIERRAACAVSSGSSSPPGLVTDVSGSTESLPRPIDIGLCDDCFEGPHKAVVDCPKYSVAKDPVVVDAAEQLADEGMWYFDDWVSCRGLNQWLSERERQTELRRTLEAALLPVLQELFQLSKQQPATVEQVLSIARNVEKSRRDFAEVFEARRAAEEAKIIEGFEEVVLSFVLVGSSGVRPTEIAAHADRIELPTLNRQRGPVVTREVFSSSSPPSNDSSPNDLPLFAHEPLEIRQPLTPHEDWSPQLSEWSVESYKVDPHAVINAAVSRALLSGLQASLPPTSTSSVVGNFSEVTQPNFRIGHDELQIDSDTITHDLREWADNFRVSKVAHVADQQDTAAGPMRDALDALHTYLSHYLDYGTWRGKNSPQVVPAELTQANLARLQQQEASSASAPPRVALKLSRPQFRLSEQQELCAVATCHIGIMEAIWHLKMFLWHNTAMELEEMFHNLTAPIPSAPAAHTSADAPGPFVPKVTKSDDTDSAMPDLEDYELGYPDSEYFRRKRENNEEMEDTTESSNDNMDVAPALGTTFIPTALALSLLPATPSEGLCSRAKSGATFLHEE